MAKSKAQSANFIEDVQVTTDCLTGRAGLNLFARYLRGVDIYPHFSRLFASVRKNSKGLPIEEALTNVRLRNHNAHHEKHGLAYCKNILQNKKKWQ